MKKWWIGYTGPNETVQQVEVLGVRHKGTEWEAPVMRLADGTIQEANRGSVFETETEARRARVLSEAEDLEGEARNWDLNAERCQDIADSSLAQAREFKGKAAELRARAKGLRDAVAESPDWPTVDAVEGRR